MSMEADILLKGCVDFWDFSCDVPNFGHNRDWFLLLFDYIKQIHQRILQITIVKSTRSLCHFISLSQACIVPTGNTACSVSHRYGNTCARLHESPGVFFNDLRACSGNSTSCILYKIVHIILKKRNLQLIRSRLNQTRNVCGVYGEKHGLCDRYLFFQALFPSPTPMSGKTAEE